MSSHPPDYDDVLRRLATPAALPPSPARNGGGEGEESSVDTTNERHVRSHASSKQRSEGLSYEVDGALNLGIASDSSSQKMFTAVSTSTQKEKIDKVDLYTSGAYDNFETVTTSFTNTFAPPPKVVSTSTKYKLFQAPTNMEVFKEFCFERKGRSKNVFCLRRNCTTTHHGDHFIMPVAPGEGYVQKDKDSAFCSPHINLALMEEDLVNEWLASSNTLEGWSELIRLAEQKSKETKSEEGNDVKVTTEVFDKAIENKAKILSFKTPKAKRKQAADSDASDEGEISSEPPVERVKDFNNDPTPIKALFQLLDGRITVLRKSLKKLWEWKRTETVFTAKLSTHMETMFQRYDRIIGIKPNNFPSEFDGPNIWSVFSNFASRFSSIDKDISAKVTSNNSSNVAAQMALEKKLNIEVSERKSDFITATDNFKNLAPRLDSSEKFTISAFQLMKKQVDAINSDLTNLKKTGASIKKTSFFGNSDHEDLEDLKKTVEDLKTNINTSRTHDPSSGDLEELKRTVDDLRTTVHSVKTANDSDSVKFGGLGFTSGPDVSAWIETNVGPWSYGWVYDFHILLQAVWSNISGEDLVKRLTKGYKLDIENGHQLATIGSFETSIPRYFKNTHGHSVTHRDQSFFSMIKTWSEWDAPHHGFRDRLKKEIERVRNDHEMNIRDILKDDSGLYILSVEALQTSYTWALGLIRFGDDIYAIYTRAKFGSAVAWHVATRLMTVLMLEIAEPRHGVAMSLKAANQKQIAQVTMLASLRSLDIMRNIQRLNFEDYPAVANELVKFLAVNTEFESIKDLQTQSKALQTELISIKRDMANAIKTQSTMANKLEQYKADKDALVKRVKALEK